MALTYVSNVIAANFLVKDVAYSPSLGLYVAVGLTSTSTATVWSSPDGVTWTGRGQPMGVNVAVWSVIRVEALGLFIAVGGTRTSTNQIATSPDGINWTGRGTFWSGTNSASGSGICWSADLSLLIAVGSISSSTSPAGNTIFSSTDGINWTGRGNPFFDAASTSYSAKDVVWSHGLNKFCVTGSSGNSAALINAANSPDGITWTPDGALSASGNPTGQAIDWSESLSMFAVAGDRSFVSAIWNSLNGTSWTLRNNFAGGPGLSPAFGIAWGSGSSLWLATETDFDTGNGYIMSSTNGISWTASITNPFGVGGHQMQRLRYSPDLNAFLVVGYPFQGGVNVGYLATVRSASGRFQAFVI